MARVAVVFLDRAGRPRIMAEGSLYQGGASLSVRVIDRHGVVRLTATMLVLRPSTIAVAVALLDRHGTPRRLFVRFLRMDRSSDISVHFFCTMRADVHNVGRLAHRHRLQADLDLNLDLNLLLDLDLALLLDLALARPRTDARNGRRLPRLPRQAGALALAVARPRADAYNGRELLRILRQALALAVARPRAHAYNGRDLLRLPRQAVALAIAWPRAHALNGHELPRFPRQAAGLAVARPRADAFNALVVFHGGLGLLAPNRRIDVPAGALGDIQHANADLARGLLQAWRHMVVAGGLAHQARLRGLFPTAALVVHGPIFAQRPAAARSPPRSPLLAAAEVCVLGALPFPFNGPPRFHVPLPVAALGPGAQPSLQAVAALGPGMPPRALPVGAPGLGVPLPPRPLAAAGLRRGPPPSPPLGSFVMDDHHLRMLEEGDAYGAQGGTGDAYGAQGGTGDAFGAQGGTGESPTSVSTILAGILALSESEQRQLMDLWLNQAPETVRNQARSNPSLSVLDQPEDLHPQETINGRMWRTFLASVGLSVASNLFLYLQYVEKKALEKGEGVETPSAWVQVFEEWLMERFLSPTFLMFLLLVLNLSVIESERHKMRFKHNGVTNIIINGLSRGAFLGVRSFPGLRHAELWARIVSVVIEILGAAFLYWKRGHWDPDIADA